MGGETDDIVIVDDAVWNMLLTQGIGKLFKFITSQSVTYACGRSDRR